MFLYVLFFVFEFSKNFYLGWWRYHVSETIFTSKQNNNILNGIIEVLKTCPICYFSMVYKSKKSKCHFVQHSNTTCILSRKYIHFYVSSIDDDVSLTTKHTLTSFNTVVLKCNCNDSYFLCIVLSNDVFLSNGCTVCLH